MKLAFLLFCCLLYAPFLRGASKIYDCFLFLNELDLLEIKLNELYPYVDKFVIVEFTETFSGKLKTLSFETNKQRFEPFSDKIIHVIVDTRVDTPNPFAREMFQRNQIARGLLDCEDSDIIILEDLDEIVRPSVFPLIRQKLLEEHLPFITCGQDLHFWYLNVFDKTVTEKEGIVWPGSIACLFSTFKTLEPEIVRGQRLYTPRILNAGWHFSYMGGPARVAYKIRSSSPPLSDLLSVFGEHPITVLKDPENFLVCPIDDTYPQFIQDHQEDLIEKGLIFVPSLSP